jgi:hypothetical protein
VVDRNGKAVRSVELVAMLGLVVTDVHTQRSTSQNIG